MKENNNGYIGDPNNRRLLTGMFRDRESAERAYDALHKRGYNKDEINVLMSDETRKKYFTNPEVTTETELGTKALEGTGVGSMIGGTVGAIVGAIAAIGTTIALPGLGLVIAGPLAAGLAGAGAGGITGGIIGALVGAGIPEERAKTYEAGIKEGGIVMGVRPKTDEDAEFVEKEWKEYKGEHIYR